jgi:hypothetical protein
MTAGITPRSVEVASAGAATAVTVDLVVTITLILILSAQEIYRATDQGFLTDAMRSLGTPLLFAFGTILIRRVLGFLG